MKTEHCPRLVVAVALVTDKQQRVLWTWNDRWGAFALPMSKPRRHRGVLESSPRAAARAAGEALGVPVEISPCWADMPDLAVSDRDCVIKHYHYEVFEAKPHAAYANRLCIRQPKVWLTPGEALSGQHQPISKPCLHLITKLIEQRRLDGRNQHTSTLIVRRPTDGYSEFLLRWNPRWQAYSLPTRGRDPEADSLAAAKQVARDELGLQPGKDITIKPAKTPTFTMHWFAQNEGDPTYYVHQLFDGKLKAGVTPASSEQLVWATEGEILIGEVVTRDRPAVPKGKISITAQQALAEVDYIPWHHALLRQSIAAAALIRRRNGGQTEWLARWNRNWHGYYFVGGHLRGGETFRNCAIREVQEELPLRPGADFNVAARRRAHVEFVAASKSAGVYTFYIMELFDAELRGRSAGQKLANNNHCRWLTKAEILNGSTSNGDAVSPTMRLLLSRLGLLPSLKLAP